jgi:hypothetical protein
LIRGKIVASERERAHLCFRRWSNALAKQTGSLNRNGKGLTSAAENVSDVTVQILAIAARAPVTA